MKTLFLFNLPEGSAMSWKCSWEFLGSQLANLIKLIALWNNFLAGSSVDHQHQTKLRKIVKDGPFKFVVKLKFHLCGSR